MPKITVRRRTKSGKQITYKTKDKGKPGKTPERERWYTPTTEMNWHKTAPINTRRRNALRAHGGDKLATARALQALANVTTDSATRRLAQADARYFYSQYRKG
jgi:hypothetical protein